MNFILFVLEIVILVSSKSTELLKEYKSRFTTIKFVIRVTIEYIIWLEIYSVFSLRCRYCRNLILWYFIYVSMVSNVWFDCKQPCRLHFIWLLIQSLITFKTYFFSILLHQYSRYLSYYILLVSMVSDARDNCKQMSSATSIIYYVLVCRWSIQINISRDKFYN